MEGAKACARFLEHAGTPPTTARSLAEALAHPVSQSGLLALAWEGRDAQRVDSFTLLEGMDGLWLFQPLQLDDQSRLTIAPCDASGAAQQIQDLARLVIPAAEE